MAGVATRVGRISHALRKALKLTKSQSRKLSEKAGKIGVSHMKSVVPVGKRSHSRGGHLAGPTMGGSLREFTYRPGNLKRSVRLFKFRRSWFVHVGPKISKQGQAKAGIHATARLADGYYGRWVKAGTKIRTTKSKANRGAISKGRNDFIGKTVQGAGASIEGELIRSFKAELSKQIKGNYLPGAIIYRIRFKL